MCDVINFLKKNKIYGQGEWEGCLAFLLVLACWPSALYKVTLPKTLISHTKMLAFRRKALAKPEGAQGHTVGELDSIGQTPKEKEACSEAKAKK